MGAFQNYPYADVHQLNLDWIIKKIREVRDKEDELDQAVSDAQGYAESAEESAESAEESARSIKDIIVTPEMFGAVGDGVTDDTQAFKDAISEAVSKNAPLVAINEYRISDTLRVNNFFSVFASLGKIRTTFTDKPLLVFKDCDGCEIFVDAINDTPNMYYGGYAFNTGTTYRYGLLPNVAIQLDACERCRVKGQVTNFNVGLRLGGTSSGGTVYNNIEGFSAWNCAYGIELYGVSGTSWANQNYINSSTVSVYTSAPDRDLSVPIHIFSASNAYSNNGNVFEGDFITANNTGVVICIESGRHNTFLIRNEGHHKVIVDKGEFNIVKTLFDLTSMSSSPGNVSLTDFDEVLQGYDLLCKYDYDDIDMAFCKGTSTYYGLSSDKMDFATINGTAIDFDRQIYLPTDIANSAGFIPARLGVLIELNDSHDLMFKIYHRTLSTDIRVCLLLLDSNKQLIMNPLDYVVDSFRAAFAMTVNGRLNTSTNSNNLMGGVTLHEDVKYAFLFSTAAYSGVEVYIRKNYPDDTNAIEGRVIRAHEYHLPYSRIYNSSIVTTKKYVGKRLYNVLNTDIWKCTAIDADGVETWSNS